MQPTFPTGREAVLEELWQKLRPDTTKNPPRRKTTVLTGSAGVGKSHVALYFAHLHDNDNNGEFTNGVLWLDARSERALQSSMADKLLSLTDYAVAETAFIGDNAMELKAWLEEEEMGRSWLLVFDAYDCESGEGEGWFDISRYIPAAGNVSVLITSRDSQLNVGQRVTIENLVGDDAVTLLAKHASIDLTLLDNTTKDSPNLVRIAERVEGLPLSLVIAGSYMRQKPSAPSEYLKLHTKTEANTEHPFHSPVAITIALSCQELKTSAPLSSRLLRLIACYHPPGIWYELLRDGCTESNEPSWLCEATATFETFLATLAPLRRYGLLQAAQNRSTFRMSRPVRKWVLRALDSEHGDCARNRLLEVVVRSIARDVPRVMKLTDKAVKHDLLRLADDLLDVIKAELTLWESGDSNKNSNLGESFAHLGDLYKNADRFADAEVWYSLARTHYTQNVGLTAIPTLAVLSELARTYSAQGRYEEALTVGSLALTGFIGAVGPDDMRVCIIQETLGKAYQHLDHPEKAEDMYTEALEGYRGSLRPSHCLTVECLDKLVGFYIGLGRNGDGRRVLERQLADCRAVFTLESVSVTRKIKDLSQMYLGGKDGSAGFHDIDIDKKLREQARSLPDEHIAAYMALHGVGACLLYEGRLDEAEEILWEAVAGHETFLGSHHYTTQRSVYYLGLLYERKGLWRVAETMWRRAIDSLSETYGYGERKLMQWVQSRLDRLRACGGESMVDGIVVEDVTEHVEGVRLGIRTSRL